MKLFAAGALLLGIFVSSGFAVTVQVPNLPVRGDNANLAPFGSGPTRYQQIYSAAAFPSGGIIDQIRFRDFPTNGLTYPSTSLDLQVGLAYAATNVTTASPIFADNIGDDFTIVLDGNVMFSNSGVPSLSFNTVLDVANTFNYEPVHGDLLVQILVRTNNPFAFFDAASSDQQQTTTRIYEYEQNINATQGSVGLTGFDKLPYGLVTEFVFVPEPSTLILACMSIIPFLLIQKYKPAS